MNIYVAPKAELISLSPHGDPRGYLVALESNSNVPFEIRRVYYIYKTQENIVRGHHAHKKLRQLLVAVSGSVEIHCEYNGKKDVFVLDTPEKGLLIDGLVWHTMEKFSPDCVLMCLASDFYDEADYIRNFQDFLKESS